MTKRHFIALADHIRRANTYKGLEVFDAVTIEKLADFCADQNPRFDRARWLAYVAGECGPHGGKPGRAC